MLIEQKIIDILKKLVSDLVDKNYNKIFEGQCNSELTEEEIKRAVYEYGGELTIPSEGAYYTDALNIIEIKKNIEYHIEFDLWINSKRSDLSMIFNVIFENNKIKQVIIKDIHVL
jgi:hypothetical protein